jgi:hypothetical protein
MNSLPANEYTAPVIRTDFSNDQEWNAITALISRSTPEGFGANVMFLNDPAHRDLTTRQLMALVPENFGQSYLLVIDNVAVSWPDHPVLVVDLHHEPGRQFRAVPSAVQSVENNLSLWNMDFREFADSVDKDGVFRGF